MDSDPTSKRFQTWIGSDQILPYFQLVFSMGRRFIVLNGIQAQELIGLIGLLQLQDVDS